MGSIPVPGSRFPSSPHLEWKVHMIVHLTHTGYYAGLVYCGAPRNETDRFVHMCDWGVKHPDLCPACKAYLEEALSDEE